MRDTILQERKNGFIDDLRILQTNGKQTFNVLHYRLLFYLCYPISFLYNLLDQHCSTEDAKGNN